MIPQVIIFFIVYGCPNPGVTRDHLSLQIYPSLRLLLSADPLHPSRQAWDLSMRSCRHSSCFLCITKTTRDGRAWPSIRWVVHCGFPVYKFGWYPNDLG
ncbi:hypothetical protein AVEN_71112-1 [Araneus ventricosus]|uniref:Uncharacterized protein n=1 Tax=Araneus ventricosus TaxID=182803 RepID=A0A4Y2HJK3_ARAVE|nr:hypothetical protein AVEN_71112-1 [Araneus ventricosus]